MGETSTLNAERGEEGDRRAARRLEMMGLPDAQVLFPDAYDVAKHCNFTRNVLDDMVRVFYLVWLPFDILSFACLSFHALLILLETRLATPLPRPTGGGRGTS